MTSVSWAGKGRGDRAHWNKGQAAWHCITGQELRATNVESGSEARGQRPAFVPWQDNVTQGRSQIHCFCPLGRQPLQGSDVQPSPTPEHREIVCSEQKQPLNGELVGKGKATRLPCLVLQGKEQVPSQAAGSKVQVPVAPAHCTAGSQSHGEDAQSEAVSRKPERKAEEQAEESGAGSGSCTRLGSLQGLPRPRCCHFLWLALGPAGQR